MTPVAIFDVDPSLLERLEAAFGPPLDSYLMGWQTWLAPAGPDEVELEYRLHPPAGFAQPAGVDHHDLWDLVIAQLAGSASPGRLVLGDEERPLDQVWVLLEVYPAFDPDVPVEQVRRWAEEALDRRARAAGDVDHERLGGAWKRRGHDMDLPAALRAALGVTEG